MRYEKGGFYFTKGWRVCSEKGVFFITQMGGFPESGALRKP